MEEVTIVFYISGHGFGHASRCIEVISALVERTAPPEAPATNGADVAADLLLAMI